MLLTILTPLTIRIFALLHYCLQFLPEEGGGELAKSSQRAMLNFPLHLEFRLKFKNTGVFRRNVARIDIVFHG